MARKKKLTIMKVEIFSDSVLLTLSNGHIVQMEIIREHIPEINNCYSIMTKLWIDNGGGQEALDLFDTTETLALYA